MFQLFGFPWEVVENMINIFFLSYAKRSFSKSD